MYIHTYRRQAVAPEDLSYGSGCSGKSVIAIGAPSENVEQPQVPLNTTGRIPDPVVPVLLLSQVLQVSPYHQQINTIQRKSKAQNHQEDPIMYALTLTAELAG